MTAVTIDRQIQCVKRELSMRKHVYPKWVTNGKITQQSSDDEIAAMQAVLGTLEQVKAVAEAAQAPGLDFGEWKLP